MVSAMCSPTSTVPSTNHCCTERRPRIFPPWTATLPPFFAPPDPTTQTHSRVGYKDVSDGRLRTSPGMCLMVNEITVSETPAGRRQPQFGCLSDATSPTLIAGRCPLLKGVHAEWTVAPYCRKTERLQTGRSPYTPIWSQTVCGVIDPPRVRRNRSRPARVSCTPTSAHPADADTARTAGHQSYLTTHLPTFEILRSMGNSSVRISSADSLESL